MVTAKFVGAWVCIILCAGALVLGAPYAAAAIPLGLLSCAFSLAPAVFK